MAMTERDRRALIIFGVVAAVALLAYLFVLRPKGGNEAGPGPTITPSSPGPQPTESVTPTPRRSSPIGPVVGGHDPFSPLVNPSISGGGGPGGSPSGGGSQPPPSGGGTTSPTGGGTQSPTGGGTQSPTQSPTGGGTQSPTQSPTVSPPGSPGATPSGGTSTQVGGHTVTLIDIFTRNGEVRVQVAVDGQVFVVTEGETFDDNFKLVSVHGTCATFLFGDQQFILCENPQK